MGYNAHIRTVNEIKHGDSLGFDEPNDLLEELEKLEKISGYEIIQWKDDYTDDIELNYESFKDAYDEYYNEDIFRVNLRNLYNDAINSESCKKNDFIRIDWF